MKGNCRRAIRPRCSTCGWGFRAGGGVSWGIQKRRIERSGQLKGLAPIRNSSHQQLIAKPTRVILAPQQGKQPSYFGVGVDDDITLGNYRRNNHATKFTTITRCRGIDRLEQFDAQLRSFGQKIKSVRIT